MVYFCTLVIMNSADCHPKPDPHVNLDYHCFVCGKEVLDDHAGIHCDDYQCGYHTSCINTVNNTYYNTSCINTVNNTYNILSKSNISWICAKCCSLNTTHSNIHDNPINGQQSCYSALSDDQIDPPDSPQCASTPVKSLRHESEKNVSKSANKLT